MKIGKKLTLSHLSLALVPMAVLAAGLLYTFGSTLKTLEHRAHDEGVVVVVTKAEEALTAAAVERIQVVHDRKCQDVAAALAAMASDIEFLATTPRVQEIYEGLKFYHDFGGVQSDGTIDVDNDSYRTIFEDARTTFSQFMGSKDYGDAFLICVAHGHVLYGHQKHADLGQNLATGPLGAEGLGLVWNQVKESRATCLQDYSPYTPADGRRAAFIATPYLDAAGEMVAVLALELTPEKINGIVNDRLGLGETGDSFLVGLDRDGGTSLRSRWATAGQELGTKKTGEFVDLVMAGQTGEGVKARPDGKEILVRYSPVSASGLKWGLVTTQDKDEALAVVAQMDEISTGIGAGIEGQRDAGLRKVTALTVVLLAVFGGLALGVTVLISRRITDPLTRALQMANAVAGGDLSVRLESGAQDEIGDLARALDRMSEGLRGMADIAMRISEGDLTDEVRPSGERDAFGNALKRMSDQLNEILAGVRRASEQVGVGSREISDSSTGLSQGATEQAASLQEITSSLTELASQVKLNAENAGQAEQLSNAAHGTAAQGVEQMSTMTAAMDEISQSSEEIAKIIKVIDDIAFQTNLLALNAAVEAARAGKHGKGFAVVAEEVRNLAGRSAKAARETAQLIEGSLGKVERGTEIARETATSLGSIVESVTRASDLVGEIAAASNEQSQGLAEISQGLGQIDAVTQQNTANSEETASAAQELSGQAAELQRLLGRFRLKGQGTATAPARQAPTPAAAARRPAAKPKPKPKPQRPAAPAKAPAPVADGGGWGEVRAAVPREPRPEEVIELTAGWPE